MNPNRWSELIVDRGKWRAMRELLREANPDLFRNWFENLDFVECNGRGLVLRAPNKFVANYIETHLGRPLLVCAKQVFGTVATIRIEVVR